MHDGAWGTMTALRSTNIELVPLADAVAEVRRVPMEEYERFGVLFGEHARLRPVHECAV